MITKPIGEENTSPITNMVDVRIEKASKLDWTEIFDTLHMIKDELSQHFPYKVLEVENAEAMISLHL